MIYFDAGSLSVHMWNYSNDTITQYICEGLDLSKGIHFSSLESGRFFIGHSNGWAILKHDISAHIMKVDQTDPKFLESLREVLELSERFLLLKFKSNSIEIWDTKNQTRISKFNLQDGQSLVRAKHGNLFVYGYSKEGGLSVFKLEPSLGTTDDPAIEESKSETPMLSTPKS